MESILPFADSVEGSTCNRFEVWLKPCFSLAHRHVNVGDNFVVRGSMRVIEFTIIAVEVAAAQSPQQRRTALSAPTPRFSAREIQFQREEGDGMDDIGYYDIGGYCKAFALIRECAELPIRHPDLFLNHGIKAPQGMLLFGPPDTGKTRIAQADANVNGPEIMYE